MPEEFDKTKQKLSDLEATIDDLDLDQISSKKGSKLKDRMVAAELEVMKQKISTLEDILADMDPDDRISSKKGSKLKDR